jgi:pyridoxamine 5'-phosphate oxidase
MPETCCLATAALPSGLPSARFVYLKELDERGFVIYSNFGTSRKAGDVGSNPQVSGLAAESWSRAHGGSQASLVFWWREVERQVRVEGLTERLSRDESQTYYATRGRGSKIGAWASRQSQVLQPEEDDGDDGRAQLDGWVEQEQDRFKDTGDEDIPCPPFWGGLRVIPHRVEFWQGRESRLHDRFVYSRTAGDKGGWKIERLSP